MRFDSVDQRRSFIWRRVTDGCMRQVVMASRQATDKAQPFGEVYRRMTRSFPKLERPLNVP